MLRLCYLQSCVTVLLVTVSNADQSRDRRGQRRVETVANDPFDVPDLPVEWTG